MKTDEEKQKVVFVSNYFNHHQKPLCDALYTLTLGSFSFISTGQMREDRRSLGYGVQEIPAYVVDGFSNKENVQRAQRLIHQAQIVIAGSAPESLLRKRIISGKILLLYQERPFKQCIHFWKQLPHFLLWHLRYPRWKPIFMLCASGYTASDYKKVGLFQGRTYRWGYFPENRQYNTQQLMRDKDPRRLLWCGRLIDWKHPVDAVDVARQLRRDGYDFELDIIGNGVMEQSLRELVAKSGLTDCVHLLGSMKPERVRSHMERAGIFLFTSDQNEGWGAVLNEAMNSGCAVVASHAIGSVPFLLENEKNGLVYTSGDRDELYEKVRSLLDDPGRQAQLGLAAYETITQVWNGETAARRLLVLAEALRQTGRCNAYESGPCSPDGLSVGNGAIFKEWFLR